MQIEEVQVCKPVGISVERKPKVSVCVVTYNHEKYIEQCLLSLLDQEVNFDYEIIVCDDCSTDDTASILNEFGMKYQNLVKIYINQENIGPSNNYIYAHSLASGEFVAHMDGDDIAFPHKLQRQVDILIGNPDVSFAAHAVRVIDSSKTIGNAQHLPTKGSIDDLLVHGTYFVNSSVMYRKAYEYRHCYGQDIVDFYLHIERATKGAIFLDKQVCGGYRMSSEGISKDLKWREKIESMYEKAFERALELGIPYNKVHSARLRRRYSFAIARLAIMDIGGYKRLISLERVDRRYATKKHLILGFLKNWPKIAIFYISMRTKFRARWHH